jgi:integrase
MRVGLWLAERHPEVRSPADWTAATCLDFVAMAAEARVGQYVFAQVAGDAGRAAAARGKPMTAKARSALLYAVRSFFADLQRWGWVEPRFAPHVAFGLPASIRRLLGPSPRDVDEVTWLKLVWASLNLAPEDLPASGAAGGAVYPFELVRAAAVLWTHAGLRANEITRLRCGCVRAQVGEITDGETGRRFPEGSVCLVEVPYSKTSAPFSKPVAGVVAAAVEAWEAVRPEQPRRLDPKTGHLVDYLLSYKGRQVSRAYLNRSLIPMLCRKAGVPTEDSRGRITSHRGRSSAVTMLANARQGMSLVELMAWCGHRSPASTMHYLRVRPARLAEAYAKADEAAYLVGVLVDAEAVRDGSAAGGAPWKYYDLGSSYCTHAFWSTCAHRLACAGCAFNVPKASSRGQALEAKASLERYLERVPLTADERSAVEGDVSKLDELLAKLAGVAAPDGATVGSAPHGDGSGEERPEVTPLIPLPVLPTTPGTDPT